MKPYTIRIADFDISQLEPEHRSKTGDKLVEAISEHLLSQYTSANKPMAAVYKDGALTIGEIPDFDDVVNVLSSGNLEEGVMLCDLILKNDPDNSVVLFNSGMALSDLGNIPEALKRLQKSFSISPQANAAIAIGVAYSRSKDDLKAKEWLERAIKLEPKNPYARRNYGGILLKLGEGKEALNVLSPLAKENAGDQSVLFAYGQALLACNEIDQADRILTQTINIAPYTPIAGAAKEERSKIAHMNFKAKADAVPRMDAVMYLVDAIKTYTEAPKDKKFAIFQEVAITGMRGLDVNNPEQKYTMRTLGGKKMSGLHMTCYMYVGGKIHMPDADMGFDLSKEYEMAKSMVGNV